MSEMDNFSLIDVRTNQSCSDPVSLPIAEAFKASFGVVLFSVPFHALVGTVIGVSLRAEMDGPADSPALATVGLDVHQCCAVSDERITPIQTTGHPGPAGSPALIQPKDPILLVDKCTISTHFGSEECVYYLRLKISSSSAKVLLSYQVEFLGFIEP
ncbi:hypothetical protein [Streptomyces sp. NPDC096339]|uniref:hypothetical protein n=1 Tax=Streptomyces sp. NPDC096339 TaxID=3366086 RepID=UPI00381EB2A3